MFQMHLQKIQHVQKPNLLQLSTATTISAVNSWVFVPHDVYLDDQTLKVTEKHYVFLSKNWIKSKCFCVIFFI